MLRQGCHRPKLVVETLTIQEALAKAVKEHPDRLQQWKRGKTKAVAQRIEEHAYGRASKVPKGGTK